MGIALGFIDEGADVMIMDIKPPDSEMFSKAASEKGRVALFREGSVANEIDVKRVVTDALSILGGLDILVCNAGIVSESPAMDLTLEEWNRVLAVNLTGVFLCCRTVLPSMVAQGHGRIINMASQLGQIGGDQMTHYSASKAGVIGYTKALSREVSAQNILVNAIAPGPIMTEMLENESDTWLARKLADLPMARFGSVAEVVPTAIFLASDDSTYFTGQTLGPNGGDVML